MPSVTWDAAFEISPADTDEWTYGDNKIRQLKEAISERGDLEHNWDTGTQPFHKAGKCSVLYSGNTTDIANLTGMSNGSIAWDTTLSTLKRYTGNAWAAMSIDHGQIAGLTDDDHTQYQLESEKGVANGYASLDANSKVLKNPANANATAGANQIVMANSGGVVSLDWLSPAANANANGYVQLPGNIYIQWGTNTAVGGVATTITFATAFPTNCFSVVATLYQDSQIDQYPLKMGTISAANFTIRNTGTANLQFYFMAVGK